MNIFDFFKQKEPYYPEDSNFSKDESIYKNPRELESEVPHVEYIDLSKDENMKRKKSHLDSIWLRPKVEKKKLTIICLENTKKSMEAKDIILKIIYKLISTDLICVITYGSTVKVEMVKKVRDFDYKKLLYMDDMNGDACLFDALKILADVVSIAYKKVLDDKSGINQYKIETIDVIGIGSGLDRGSKTKREEAIKSFDEILLNKDVETKYFCFSENNFKEVASIGFRSIGAFPSKKI